MWAVGAAYEPYAGRWSRLVARQFFQWLEVPRGRAWVDVGCGTGALTETALALMTPARVTSIDPSEGFVAHARHHVRDPRAAFLVGDAESLPLGRSGSDAIVSGLVLNFVPRPDVALAEMARVARPGGVVAAYVWDYAGKMQLTRYFWEAAAALDPAARDLDQGRRFPLCAPEPLRALFEGAGLREVEVRAIDIETRFRDFDDYWGPFLGGQGPAPGYARSLSETARVALRERIRGSLPVAPNGAIPLVARAWAVRGRR